MNVDSLFKTFWARLVRYFYARVSDHELAEDLAQDTLVRILESINGYSDRGCPLGAWVFRIAHNLLIDYRRRAKNRITLGLEVLGDVHEPSATWALDCVALRDDLFGAMRPLTPAQQRVIALRFFADHSIDETASEVGKTCESVKKIQRRGLDTMRDRLALSA